MRENSKRGKKEEIMQLAKARSVEQKKGVPVGAGSPRPVNNACYYANGNGQSTNTDSRQECQERPTKPSAGLSNTYCNPGAI